jgi:putative hydrolase of the HAD superfamily
MKGKNLSKEKSCTVDVILFDFGGVLAEEGFIKGLGAIAQQNGLEREPFVKTGFNLIHKVGYLLGTASEKDYWIALREKTSIKGEDPELRGVILSHFKLRTWMIELIERLREAHIRLGILSDQTNWLDELDVKYGFFKRFDYVFNSYHLGKSKRDPTVFEDVLGLMNVKAHQVLFVDDYAGNVEKAKGRGLHALHYEDRERFQGDLAYFCPFLKSRKTDN